MQESRLLLGLHLEEGLVQFLLDTSHLCFVEPRRKQHCSGEKEGDGAECHAPPQPSVEVVKALHPIKISACGQCRDRHALWGGGHPDLPLSTPLSSAASGGRLVLSGTVCLGFRISVITVPLATFCTALIHKTLVVQHQGGKRRQRRTKTYLGTCGAVGTQPRFLMGERSQAFACWSARTGLD